MDRNLCGFSVGLGVVVLVNFCMFVIGIEMNGFIVCFLYVNGVVGIKFIVGLVSRVGIILIFEIQDIVGFMVRIVKDVVICLGVLIGIDQRDGKIIVSEGNVFIDYIFFLKKDGFKGKKIGLYIWVLGFYY